MCHTRIPRVSEREPRVRDDYLSWRDAILVGLFTYLRKLINVHFLDFSTFLFFIFPRKHLFLSVEFAESSVNLNS